MDKPPDPPPEKKRLVSNVNKSYKVTSFFGSKADAAIAEPKTDNSAAGHNILSSDKADTAASLTASTSPKEIAVGQLHLKFDITVVFIKTDPENSMSRKLDRRVPLLDLQKRDLLLNHQIPDETFIYAYGCIKTQKVFLSGAHLTGKNGAFKYSFAMKGVVCVPSVLF